ncbi:hotdog fold domain-containing protein [Streptomyces microflavus]|uniref:hotdog fold domain-containing protein n=1 Tax=Streptomyces microflavus TaxID=1919 RepID=UPI00380D87E9
MTPTTDQEPLTVSLRVRIGHEDAHYGGQLVDGARILRLFGDLVTEITIRSDGDEGLLSEYACIRFTAPVHPGDYVEATVRLVRSTKLRRFVELKARKVIAATGEGPSSAAVRRRRSGPGTAFRCSVSSSSSGPPTGRWSGGPPSSRPPCPPTTRPSSWS